MSPLTELISPDLLTAEALDKIRSALELHPALETQAFCRVFLDDQDMSDAPFRAISMGDEPEPSTSLMCISLSGKPEVGMKLRQLPDGYEASVVSVQADSSDINYLLTLDKPVIMGAGHLWMVSNQPATVGHQVDVNLLWLADKPLLPGRTYRLHSATGVVDANVSAIKYRTGVDPSDKMAAKILSKNSLGVCTLSLSRDIAFDPVTENPMTGSFLLREQGGKEVLGIGGINFTLRRSDNITLQRLDINKQARSELKGQKPSVVWLTGLSGSGKSTIANILEQKLHALGKHTYLLDGDNVRHGLNKDLGFTDEDRVENIRRISEVAKLMVDAGLIVLTAFISPFRAERKMARDIFADDEFIEVYVNTSLEVAEKRDVKGLYKKARSGQLKNFTGIDSPYEEPENPECEVCTDQMSAEEAADQLLLSLNL